jgi:hypothetical protein
MIAALDKYRVPLGTVRRWRLVGGGPPFIKIGNLVRYRRTDVEAWLASLGGGK